MTPATKLINITWSTLLLINSSELNINIGRINNGASDSCQLGIRRGMVKVTNRKM